MIPGESEGEVTSEVEIKATTMPVSIFELLWAGLSSHEELYGGSDRIEAARNWMNLTMQGRESYD